MSLRSFHILFIVVSLGLSAFLARWAAAHGEDWLVAVSSLGLAVGIPYLIWFVRKSRVPTLPPGFQGAALLALLAFTPRPVSACAVCFGGGNADVARAFFLGILALVLPTFGLLAWLVVAMVKIEKARALALAKLDAGPGGSAPGPTSA